MTPEPPLATWAARVLVALLPEQDGAALAADLREEYRAELSRVGRSAADRWFVGQVVLACAWALRDRGRDGVVAAATLLRSLAGARAVRALRSRPGFSAAVLAITAIASGTIASLAGVHRATSTLPWDRAEELHVLVSTDGTRGWSEALLSVPELDDLRERAPSLGPTGRFVPDVPVTLGEGPSNVSVRASLVDGPYLDLLGAEALLGRLFTRAEIDDPGRHSVVPSEALWRATLGADPAVVGSSVVLSGTPFQVVGVASFADMGRRGEPTDLWLPMSRLDDLVLQGAASVRVARTMLALVRIDPGALRATRRTLDAVAAELRQAHPAAHRSRGFGLVDARRWWFGSTLDAMPMLFGAGLMLAALVTASLAALYRVRTEEWRAELRLRSALGASRTDLIAWVGSEATLLVALGAAAGWVGAVLALGGEGAPRLIGLPSFVRPTPHLTVLAATALATGAVGLSLGTLLARGTGRAGRSGLQRPGLAAPLDAVEAGIAVALLVLASASVRSVVEVTRAGTGYELEDRWIWPVDLTRTDVDQPTARRERPAVAAALVTEVERLPGVVRATLVGPDPIGDSRWHLVFVPAPLDPQEHAGRWLAQRLVVGAGGLGTLGVDLLQGRDFEPTDRAGPRRVAVVDERIARRFWPEGEWVGRPFCGSAACVQPYTVVGVAEVARHRGRWGRDEAVVGDVYLPYAVEPWQRASLVVQTEGGRPPPERRVRETVARLAPFASVGGGRTLRGHLRAQEAPTRFSALLLGVYSVAGGLLALAATYGLLAYRARRLRRELAVRTALGATTERLARDLLATTLTATAVGTASGFAVTALVLWLYPSLLFVPGVTVAWPEVPVVVAYLAAAAFTWLAALRGIGSLDAASVLTRSPRALTAPGRPWAS